MKYHCELIGGSECVIDAKSRGHARERLGFESHGEGSPDHLTTAYSVVHDGRAAVLIVTGLSDQQLLSALKATGQLGQPTVKAARKLHDDRQRRKSGEGEASTPRQRLRRRQRVVMLGEDDARRAQRRARADYPRRQNWLSSKEALLAVPFHVQEIDNGRYSSRCTYTHWTYRPCVQSYGTVLPSGLHYRLWGVKYHFPNPRGYEWRIDRNGIALVRLADPRDDYHPTSGDLVVDGKRSTLRSLTARLRANAAARRAARAAQRKAAREAKARAEQEASLIRRAEREGCRVCLRDSVRAGNCAAGTETWARRHGLSPNGHYPPSEVLALANGDASRVAIVVATALRRHLEEMRQGFCRLDDHA